MLALRRQAMMDAHGEAGVVFGMDAADAFVYRRRWRVEARLTAVFLRAFRDIAYREATRD